jgi:DNA-binding MarR family transcriptional regulator
MKTPPMKRRRDTILQALESFRAIHPGLTLTHLVILLYVAENEGLTLSELASVGRMSLATASRAARALTGAEETDSLPPHAPLLHVRPNPANSNGRIVRLSSAGRSLISQFDDLIGAPVPIRTRAA